MEVTITSENFENLKNGELVDTKVGALPKAKLKQLFEALL